jgi:hypothetical protein
VCDDDENDGMCCAFNGDVKFPRSCTLASGHGGICNWPLNPAKPREAAKDSPAPTGYRLADGWGRYPIADGELVHSCDGGFGCGLPTLRKHQPALSDDLFACAVHAVEMGAIVPVEPAPQPEAPAVDILDALKIALAPKKAPLPAEPPSVAGQVCGNCEIGHPINDDGEHYGTQRLGMISNTRCAKLPPAPSEPAKVESVIPSQPMAEWEREAVRERISPSPRTEESEPAKARCRIATQSACYAPSECDKADRCLGGRGSLVPSEPAKAPLSERMLQGGKRIEWANEVADLEARLYAADTLNESYKFQVTDLTKRLAEAEKARDAWEGKANETELLNVLLLRDTEAAETARDEAVAKLDLWAKTNEDNVAEAALAERARVNGWWREFMKQGITRKERDAGIASGAPAPKGSAT